MKMLGKYIGLWTFVWLQCYYFFDELGALIAHTPIQLAILAVLVLYCTHFIVYFFLLMDKRISPKFQHYADTFFCLFGLLFAAAMLAYVLVNPWLRSSEATFPQIVLEVGKFVAMALSTLVACFYHFIKKETIDMSDKKLWSTYDTYDLAFWGALTFFGFFLTISLSKAAYMNRNYYHFIRWLLTYTIILLAMNKNRLFQNQRRLFYSVLIGFFITCSIQGILTIFFTNVDQYELLKAVKDATTPIFVSDALVVVHWLIIAGWIFWDLRQENKPKKIAKQA